MKEAVWRERIWSAIHEEGRDVGGVEAIATLAEEIGVAPDLAGDAERVVEASERARAAGVRAVPTFLVDRWPMGGIQDDYAMTCFFERYVRKRRRETGRA